MSAKTIPLNRRSYRHGYCGCCGNELIRPGDGGLDGWCGRCRMHVLKDRRPPHERTYFAQFKEECPYDLTLLLPQA